VQQCSNALSEVQRAFSRQRKFCRRIAVTSINCKVPFARMIAKKCAAPFTIVASAWRLRRHHAPTTRPHKKEPQMPHAVASDNVRLYFEEAGSGTPILFLHEFAADHTNWEPQMRYFSRGHRCIAYSARGYTPSDVPTSAESYSYKHFYTDAFAVSRVPRRISSGSQWAPIRRCMPQ
jgi:hypothetical protein